MILSKCKWCDNRCVEAHKIHTSMCIDCGRRYAAYLAYRAQQKQCYSETRAKQLQVLIDYYVVMKQYGFKTPRDLTQIPEPYVKQTLDRCAFCGSTFVDIHPKYTDRCVECGRRYTRYANCLALLRKAYDPRVAQRLTKIEQEYEDLRQRGYNVPRKIKDRWS